jgi:hypothetical protein
MANYLPAVEELNETSPKIAFNLLMYISEHLYDDLEVCLNQAGDGDIEKHYKKLDSATVETISKRVAKEGRGLVVLTPMISMSLTKEDHAQYI